MLEKLPILLSLSINKKLYDRRNDLIGFIKLPSENQVISDFSSSKARDQCMLAQKDVSYHHFLLYYFL